MIILLLFVFNPLCPPLLVKPKCTRSLDGIKRFCVFNNYLHQMSLTIPAGEVTSTPATIGTEGSHPTSFTSLTSCLRFAFVIFSQGSPHVLNFSPLLFFINSPIFSALLTLTFTGSFFLPSTHPFLFPIRHRPPC